MSSLSTFIGREEELTRLGQLIAERRMVTVVGPGGIGKTRLAAEITALSAEAFPEGIRRCELAPISPRDDIGAEVAGELGFASVDALVQQLSASLGLSGRSRQTGSAAERARSTVTWRIRAAVKRLGDAHPQLRRHLRNAVRTGTWCTYRPETTVVWRVETGR